MIYAAPGAAGAKVVYKPRYDNFIGGQWVAPVKGQYFDVVTPISGKVYTQAARSTSEDIELALDAAHAAADKWGKTDAATRSNILLKIADRIEQNLELLAYAETVDNGKPIRETLNADIPLAVDHFRYFAGAVRAVIEHFGVRLMVSLGSVPMAVPHTRPVQLTTHATSQRLVLRQNIWEGELRIPSSAQGLLEIRLGEWGHDAMGYVAHIPHYVAQYPYPAASAALIEAVGDTTGLIFDISGLLSAASSTAEELASQVSDNEEIRNVVHGLEQQYDAFHQAGADNLLAEDQPIPTGDELGAQFEQFLAGLDDDGTDR